MRFGGPDLRAVPICVECGAEIYNGRPNKKYCRDCARKRQVLQQEEFVKAKGNSSAAFWNSRPRTRR